MVKSENKQIFDKIMKTTNQKNKMQQSVSDQTMF